MKLISTAFFVFQFFGLCLAQTQIDTSANNSDLTNDIKYGFSINQSLTRYGVPTSVLFTLNWKKHQFDLGPQFRLGKSINEYQKNIGLEFNYRFYPMSDTAWFSSYALFNSNYFYEFTKSDGIYSSDDPLLNGQASVTKSKVNHLAFNLGYGIKFRFTEGFYIGSHAGIGIHTPFDVKERTLPNVDWTNIEKRSETNLGFIVSFYLGYKF